MTDGAKVYVSGEDGSADRVHGEPDGGALRDRLASLPPDVQEKLLAAQERMGELNERAMTFAREKPLVAVGLAAAAGFFLGRIASRR